MKKLLTLLVALCLTAGIMGCSEDTKKKTKDAGTDVKKAGEAAAKDVKDAGADAAKKVGDAAKDAKDAAAEAVKKVEPPKE